MDNTMSENQQESEPLLDDADYQLLRCDSFLTRVGSNNFASLIESTSHHTAENVELREQQEQQHQQLPQEQQISEMQLLQESAIEESLLINSNIHKLHADDFILGNNEAWGLLDGPTQCDFVNPEDSVVASDGNSSTSFIPDSTPNRQMPSLQTWPGQYDFKISLPVGNKDRNKWCYSMAQNKLYVCTNVAVPIKVQLLQWLDASVTITPVFKASRHRVEPVMPCFNCKRSATTDPPGHLVMVEGQECDYKQISERYVVSLPLLPPPPGEVDSTLLVKLTCLTSCVGGPNRRPFCLVFTLHDSCGAVIGRQVLDVKCCKCPSRDMMNEDKAALRRQHSEQPNESQPLDCGETMKRPVQVTTTGEKKKRFKMEPGMEQRYMNLPIPVEYVRKVKVYVNGLIAADYISRNQPNLLLFSEDEL